TGRKRNTARVQAIYEAAFREYGMPEAIRTDNGPPFASHAVSGLSRLAVWWIKLGIVPERLAAGHPEQNGSHERMHRTLKQEAAQPPAADRRKQQQELHRFRQEYNQVRPHEALGMQTPAALYRPSARDYPSRVPEPEYPATMVVRSAHGQGIFRWKKHDVFLTEVLWGENVGLLPEDDRWFTIYFAQHPLARFDSQNLCVTPLPKKCSQATSVAGKGGSPPFPSSSSTPSGGFQCVSHPPGLECQLSARPHTTKTLRARRGRAASERLARKRRHLHAQFAEVCERKGVAGARRGKYLKRKRLVGRCGE